MRLYTRTKKRLAYIPDKYLKTLCTHIVASSSNNEYYYKDKYIVNEYQKSVLSRCKDVISMDFIVPGEEHSAIYGLYITNVNEFIKQVQEIVMKDKKYPLDSRRY